ncbi:PAAR domain-containing protein [Pseudomonas mucidolens]|uniref:PAAR domain-containing protein n=1 Tax=Pseudomonas mucidolens TaxID=46679 RepID=UPI0030DD2B81
MRDSHEDSVKDPIAEGSSTYSVNGIPVALDGMKTACGATLIASSSHGAVHR